MALLLPLLYALSGAAALLHETVFLRITGLRVESSAGAVGTVVALMMGGLALGSWAASRAGFRGPKAFKAFLMAEVLIGITGGAAPFLCEGLSPIFGLIYRGSGAEGFLFEAGRAILMACVILPPAALMGATFPWALSSLKGGPRVGLMYGVNALGGSVSALAGSLWILPALGTLRTAFLAASLNFLTAALGWIFLRALDRSKSPARRPSEPTPRTSAPASFENMGILFLTGFCGMVWEVAWTRALAVCLGPTSYAFGVILACYVLGISLGAFLGGGLAVHLKLRPWIRGLVLVAGAMLAAATTILLPRLPFLPAQVMGGAILDPSIQLRWIALASLACLGPVCVVLGAVMPLFCGSSPGPSYAANCAGAVAGALCAAHVFLSHFGVRGSILTAAGILAGLGLYHLSTRLRFPLRAALAACLAALVVQAPWPRPDSRVLYGGSYLYYARYQNPKHIGNTQTLFVRDGPEATVAVFREKDNVYFAVNGKVDGSLRGDDMNTQVFSADLPMSLHPSPRRVLVVGLGTGVTASKALAYPGLESLDCVEILPEVAEAQKFFAHATGDLLGNPRFHLKIGDGRSLLMHGKGGYDVIISEPSNPWMPGSALLFTREFFQACWAALNQDGLCALWIQGYGLRPESIAMVARTFLQAFPGAQLWRTGVTGSDLILLGSKSGVPSIPWERLKEIEASGRWISHEPEPRPLSLADFLSRCSLSSRALARFCGEGVIVTDDKAQLEYLALRQAPLMSQSTMTKILSEIADSLAPDLGAGAPADIQALLQERLLCLRSIHALLYDYKAGVRDILPRIRESARTCSLSPEARSVLAGLAKGVHASLSSVQGNQTPLESLELALELDPVAARTGDLAKALVQQRRYQEADRRILDGLRTHPGHAGLLRIRADILVRMGDLLGAEKAQRLVLQEEPGNALAWANLGLILRRRGLQPQAEAAFSKASELDPKLSLPGDPPNN